MIETSVLTVNEAAKILRLSKNVAYAAVASGDLPSFRMGKKILISRACIDALLAAPPLNKPTTAPAVSEQKIVRATIALEKAIARAAAVLDELRAEGGSVDE